MTTLTFRSIEITWTDYPDAHDCAVIVYFTGCEHHCPGCQNPDLCNHFMEERISPEGLFQLIKDYAFRGRTHRIVFSGGDCGYQDNLGINRLIRLLKESGYDLCIYTGFDIQWCQNNIPGADFYKCGTYVERKKETEWGKTDDKMVFATRNQKLYDKEYRQISIDNVYYFSKWKTLKAKVKRLFAER